MPDISKLSDEELRQQYLRSLSDDELRQHAAVPPPQSQAQYYAKDIGKGAVRGGVAGVEQLTTAGPALLSKAGEFFDTPAETAERKSRMQAIANVRGKSPSQFVKEHVGAPETEIGKITESTLEAAPSVVLQRGGPITKAATTLGIGGGGYLGEKGAEVLGVDPVVGHTIGSVVGGVVTGGGAQLTAEREARKLLPTAQDNRNAAKGAIKEMEKHGFVVDPSEVQNFTTGLRADLEGPGNLFSPEGGQGGIAFRAADQIDRAGGNMASVLNTHSALGKVTPDKGMDYAAALAARDAIREWIGNLQPNQMIKGDPQLFNNLWKFHRDTWRTYSNLEEIEAARESAEWRRLASGRGTNLNTMRQEIRKIIDNDTKARHFSDEAKAQMERIVEGDFARNTMRRIAAFAPHGSVSSAPVLFAVATEGAGTGGAVALSAFLVHFLQGKLEERSITTLLDIIREGSPLMTGTQRRARAALLPPGRVTTAGARGALSAGAGSPLEADQHD